MCLIFLLPVRQLSIKFYFDNSSQPYSIVSRWKCGADNQQYNKQYFDNRQKQICVVTSPFVSAIIYYRQLVLLPNSWKGRALSLAKIALFSDTGNAAGSVRFRKPTICTYFLNGLNGLNSWAVCNVCENDARTYLCSLITSRPTVTFLTKRPLRSLTKKKRKRFLIKQTNKRQMAEKVGSFKELTLNSQKWFICNFSL